MSEKRVCDQISTSTIAGILRLPFPSLQGFFVISALSCTTISMSYRTTFSYCFHIEIPSFITNYSVFSLVSLSQSLKMLFQRNISSSTAVHTATPCLDQTFRSWAVSVGSLRRSPSFLPRMATPQLEDSCYNTETL